MGFRLLPEAEAELDDIWLYVARESGSSDIATRLIEGITGRLWLLAQHPQIGRPSVEMSLDVARTSPYATRLLARRRGARTPENLLRRVCKLLLQQGAHIQS